MSHQVVEDHKTLQRLWSSLDSLKSLLDLNEISSFFQGYICKFFYIIISLNYSISLISTAFVGVTNKKR
jgi:hypothetical protein